MVALGLNRWNWQSPVEFAAAAARAEAAGIDAALLPVNPLACPDPYVLMAAGAAATSRMTFGTLLETPMLRPPAVAAGSVATVARTAPGRVLFTYGVGDTAVRWLGMRPARLAELETATTEMRALLAGERLEVGADVPAWLRHAEPVPVWIAASGPRSLRMAGRCADGVFLRVGTHPANIETAVAAVRAGASEAGRDPSEVRLALIVHTVWGASEADVGSIARAMAAGFYEYAPAMFDPPGFEWNGPPIEELMSQVWPDFHHAADLPAAGRLVDFLSDEVAGSFSFVGDADRIAAQIRAILAAVPELEMVVPHPVPMPSVAALDAYVDWLTGDLRPLL